MSTQSRLDALKAMAEKKPDDAMVHYGLGLEYKKAGDLGAAVEAFRNVVRVNPDYTAAHQELGAALAALGRGEEACEALAAGVATADRTGAWKAREHMQRLLDEIKAGAPPACDPQPDGFCE